jgi:hypothetical protein
MVHAAERPELCSAATPDSPRKVIHVTRATLRSSLATPLSDKRDWSVLSLPSLRISLTLSEGATRSARASATSSVTALGSSHASLLQAVSNKQAAVMGASEKRIMVKRVS